MTKLTALQKAVINNPPSSYTRYSARAGENFKNLNDSEKSDFMRHNLGDDVYHLIRTLKQEKAFKDPEVSYFVKNNLVFLILFVTEFVNFALSHIQHISYNICFVCRNCKLKKQRRQSIQLVRRSTWRICMEKSSSMKWNAISSALTTTTSTASRAFQGGHSR